MNDSKPQENEMTDQPVEPPGKRQSGLNREIQARIGHQLRAMYDDVVRQGVPDRFVELLRQIDQPSTPSTGTSEERFE